MVINNSLSSEAKIEMSLMGHKPGDALSQEEINELAVAQEKMQEEITHTEKPPPEKSPVSLLPKIEETSGSESGGTSTGASGKISTAPQPRLVLDYFSPQFSSEDEDEDEELEPKE